MCGVWEELYDWVEKRCKEVVVANPCRTKAIASAKIKTDKLDSTILTNLLRVGYTAKGKQWLKHLNNEQINCYLRLLETIETEIKVHMP